MKGWKCKQCIYKLKKCYHPGFIHYVHHCITVFPFIAVKQQNATRDITPMEIELSRFYILIFNNTCIV